MENLAMAKVGVIGVTQSGMVGQQQINISKPETRYAVDGMNPITIDDLRNNAVAIKSLMLDHAMMAKQLEDARNTLNSKEGEIEYLKTSPFMSIFTLIVTCVSGVIAGIGINLITSEKPPWYSTLQICLGSVLAVLAGIANVLYPYARRWFNR